MRGFAAAPGSPLACIRQAPTRRVEELLIVLSQFVLDVLGQALSSVGDLTPDRLAIV